MQAAALRRLPCRALPILCRAWPVWLVPAAPVTPLQACHPEQQQDDEGSDDGAKDADTAEVVRLYGVIFDKLPQEPADERAENAHRDRAEDADAVPARPGRSMRATSPAMSPMTSRTTMNANMRT
jgi:hypothetical protein